MYDSMNTVCLCWTCCKMFVPFSSILGHRGSLGSVSVTASHGCWISRIAKPEMTLEQGKYVWIKIQIGEFNAHVKIWYILFNYCIYIFLNLHMLYIHIRFCKTFLAKKWHPWKVGTRWEVYSRESVSEWWDAMPLLFHGVQAEEESAEDDETVCLDEEVQMFHQIEWEELQKGKISVSKLLWSLSKLKNRLQARVTSVESGDIAQRLR